jgi:hypothetical protein
VVRDDLALTLQPAVPFDILTQDCSELPFEVSMVVKSSPFRFQITKTEGGKI